MPVFRYTICDAKGRQQQGTLWADTARHARDQLRLAGFQIDQIRTVRNSLSRYFAAIPLRPGTRRPSADLLREIATLLQVGLPLAEALSSLANSATPADRDCLLTLAEQVSFGKPLSQAMGEQPTRFDRFTLAMTQVGEQTGRLDASLVDAANLLQRLQEFRNKLLTPLIYPACVLTVGIAIGFFLMTYVVPQVINNLPDPTQPLPWITLLLKSVSDFLLQYWFAVGILFVIALVALRWMFTRPPIRRRIDRLVLRIPLFGNLIIKQSLARLCQALSALLRSGIELDRAMLLSQPIIQNACLRDELEHIRQRIVAGTDIGQAATQSALIPSTLANVFRLGQQSGELDTLLDRMASLYDQQVSLASQRLLAALEPLLIIALVVFIGSIALATLLPILRAGETL
jgi:general secretion pathway protein F